MNENLDLTKILEGCPAGTEFYSSVYGNLTFIKITLFNTIIMMNTRCRYSFTKDGRLYYGIGECTLFPYYGDGECTLFPSKEQRDWSKFVRFWDKPKEKFDPKTLQPFDKVLVRNNKDEYWSAMFFSHMDDYLDIHRAVCGYYSWAKCIPYNDETKHLVGTKEDCPEYYKWWEE